MKQSVTRLNEARYLTTKEVGALFGITERTVRERVARGQFPEPFRMPTAAGGRGRLMFRPSDIEKYLAKMPKAAS